jgi:hypothetical protein
MYAKVSLKIDCHKGMFDYDVTCLRSGHVMWCIITCGAGMAYPDDTPDLNP